MNPTEILINKYHAFLISAFDEACDHKCKVTKTEEHIIIENTFGNKCYVEINMKIMTNVNVPIQFLDFLKEFATNELLDITVISDRNVTFTMNGIRFLAYINGYYDSTISLTSLYSCIMNNDKSNDSYTITKTKDTPNLNTINLLDFIKRVGDMTSEKYLRDNIKTLCQSRGYNLRDGDILKKVDEQTYVICQTGKSGILNKITDATNIIDTIVIDSSTVNDDNLTVLDCEELTNKLNLLQNMLKIRQNDIDQLVRKKVKDNFDVVIRNIPSDYTQILQKQEPKKEELNEELKETKKEELKQKTFTSEQITKQYQKHKRFVKSYNGQIVDRETFITICKDENINDETTLVLAYIIYDMEQDVRDVLFLV